MELPRKKQGQSVGVPWHLSEYWNPEGRMSQRASGLITERCSEWQTKILLLPGAVEGCGEIGGGEVDESCGWVGGDEGGPEGDIGGVLD